jgi:endonuclease/exonuclease/phosphatase family metal-dependent hydrolase
MSRSTPVFSSSWPARVLAITALVLLFGDVARGQDYRVMSFNVRVGSANDGRNGWDYRKTLVAKTIANFNPDFFGVQESLSYQSSYLLNNLSGYQKVGTGRSADGSGEQTAIFYKTSKFTKVRSGQYWLSTRPNTPGTLGWDAQFPRTVTWIQLRDKANPDLSFVYFNTHWDHVGDQARFNSATLMRQKVKEIAPGLPAILSGDFNADEGSSPYRRLRGQDNFDTIRDFQDSFATIHPDTHRTVGTAHGFTGKTGDRRIDWILPDWDWDVLNASIVRTSYDGRYPSDHFPITAVVRASPFSASLSASVTAVPEPATAALVIIGGAALLVRRRP